MQKLKKYGIDWFILAIGILIAGAYFFPHIGTQTKPVNLSKIAGYGISFVFFFYGAKLSKKQFSQGISNIKMHLIIQLTTFVVFPVILIVLKPLFQNQNMWLAVFFVASLPSTVSSSVVMVSLAKGNVPGAIFNATISSFGGILITPFWMGIFMVSQKMGFDISSIILKLVFQILIPIIVGMLLNPLLGRFVNKFSKQFKIADQSIVLLIIYTSFCKSFSTGAFEILNSTNLLLLIVGMFALFLSMFFMLKFVSKLFRFHYQDAITTMFCGSKKSLLHGVAISKVLFAGMPIAGIILLPIMLYHPMQLIFVSMYASSRRGK